MLQIETDQGRLVYDAVWAVGLALNNTSVNASREEFREELNKLSFDRASVSACDFIAAQKGNLTLVA